jgi:hypothetical protein
MTDEFSLCPLNKFEECKLSYCAWWHFDIKNDEGCAIQMIGRKLSHIEDGVGNER